MSDERMNGSKGQKVMAMAVSVTLFLLACCVPTPRVRQKSTLQVRAMFLRLRNRCTELVPLFIVAFCASRCVHVFVSLCTSSNHFWEDPLCPCKLSSRRKSWISSPADLRLRSQKFAVTVCVWWSTLTRPGAMTSTPLKPKLQHHRNSFSSSTALK